MNTFNHYAYGLIGHWMYRQIVGIDTYEDGPGYKHIKIKPQIGEGFTYASASLKIYYGTVSSGWKVEGNNIILDVKIPANTKATVFLPSANTSEITESGKPLTALEAPLSNEENYTILQLGSGKYSFRIEK